MKKLPKRPGRKVVVPSNPGAAPMASVTRTAIAQLRLCNAPASWGEGHALILASVANDQSALLNNEALRWMHAQLYSESPETVEKALPLIRSALKRKFHSDEYRMILHFVQHGDDKAKPEKLAHDFRVTASSVRNARSAIRRLSR